MKNIILFDAGYTVYPGSYVPVLKDEEVIAELKGVPGAKTDSHPLNVNELADSFKVEMTIPGVNREDFFIHADKNVLSVSVVHKDRGWIDTQFEQPPHFSERSDRHIVLPEFADPAFISAEYRSGVLCLYVSKSRQPPKHLHTDIVVY